MKGAVIGVTAVEDDSGGCPLSSVSPYTRRPAVVAAREHSDLPLSHLLAETRIEYTNRVLDTIARSCSVENQLVDCVLTYADAQDILPASKVLTKAVYHRKSHVTAPSPWLFQSGLQPPVSRHPKALV